MLPLLPYKETIILSAWDLRLTSHVPDDITNKRGFTHVLPLCPWRCGKRLLCNFCNLGERYVFKDSSGVERSPQGDRKLCLLSSDCDVKESVSVGVLYMYKAG